MERNIFHPSVWWCMRGRGPHAEPLHVPESTTENVSSASTSTTTTSTSSPPPPPISSSSSSSSSFSMRSHYHEKDENPLSLDSLSSIWKQFAFSSSPPLVAKDALPFVRASSSTDSRSSSSSSPTTSSSVAFSHFSKECSTSPTSQTVYPRGTHKKGGNSTEYATPSATPTTPLTSSTPLMKKEPYQSSWNGAAGERDVVSYRRISDVEKGGRKRAILKRHTKHAVMAISSLLVNHHRRPSRGRTEGNSSPHKDNPEGLEGGGGKGKKTLPVASTAKPWIESSTLPSTLQKKDGRDVLGSTGTIQEKSDSLSSDALHYTLSPAVSKAKAAIAAAHAANELEKKKKETSSPSPPSSSSTHSSTSRTSHTTEKESDSSSSSLFTSSTSKHTFDKSQGREGKEKEGFQKKYEEHRILGWSPEQVYRVVADVDRYSEFLPWCPSSVVHGPLHPSESSSVFPSSEIPESPAVPSGRKEVIATLMVGFSFLKEAYTSHVLMEPPYRVVATLHTEQYSTSSSSSSNSRAPQDRKTGGQEKMEGQERGDDGSTSDGRGGGFLTHMFRRAVGTVLHPPSFRHGKNTSESSSTGYSFDGRSSSGGRSILQQLRSEWVLKPVKNQPDSVEVHFFVAFEFRHPMYGALIMSNIVSLMTHSFERRCEALYGPPSRPSEALR